MEDISHDEEDHLDQDVNSLKILGKSAPDSDFDVALPYGKMAISYSYICVSKDIEELVIVQRVLKLKFCLQMDNLILGFFFCLNLFYLVYSVCWSCLLSVTRCHHSIRTVETHELCQAPTNALQRVCHPWPISDLSSLSCHVRWLRAGNVTTFCFVFCHVYADVTINLQSCLVWWDLWRGLSCECYLSCQWTFPDAGEQCVMKDWHI